MNIAFVLSYTGTNFHGWQKQKNASTIQETLEHAVYRVTGKQISISRSLILVITGMIFPVEHCKYIRA